MRKISSALSSMTATEPIFTKCILARLFLKKNFPTEFHENPMKNPVADTTPQTDRPTGGNNPQTTFLFSAALRL
jgi:hypothetical protein